MVGMRTENEQIFYPVSELAAPYGASAREETSDYEQAYRDAGFARSRRERPSYWDQPPLGVARLDHSSGEIVAKNRPRARSRLVTSA